MKSMKYVKVTETFDSYDSFVFTKFYITFSKLKIIIKLTAQFFNL